MQRFFSFLVGFQIITISLFAQQGLVKMFSSDILCNPIENFAWFDSNLPIEYIGKYSFSTDEYIVTLENGYIQHKIRNKEIIAGQIPSLPPLCVDIVFSNYPLNKAEWHTNYYQLLANRLKELFSIDSTLNSTTIRWRLVMQNDCTNAEEASKLFHGIAIRYNPLATQETKPEPSPRANEFNQKVGPTKERVADTYPEWDYIVIERKYYNPDDINPKPSKGKKKKRWKEPSCPTFTTRAEKPRNSIWSRLFR